MTTKQKRLSVAERVRILERLEVGEKAIDLANEFGVSLQAIIKIKKNKENILQNKTILEKCQGKSTKKRCTKVENSRLEQSLYQWFLQKRSIGDPVTGPMLQEKAMHFNEMLGGPSTFRASNGYLDRFKKRHGIRSLSIQGEKISADHNASENFRQYLSTYMEENNITMDRLYNADETGLLWKMLPTKTLVAGNENEAAGRKSAKDRVTVMVCANASGSHKIPLLVVGKSKNPRCFKNVRVLPVIYKGQPSAWMDRTLTLEWYRDIFLPEILKKHGPSGEKCLLLLDNAPSHPPADTLNSINDACTVMYLPPNVTSLIQPMDQGVIEKMKRVYRKNLLRLLLTEETFDGANRLLKSLNMLNVCNFVAVAWGEVTPLNIHKCWKKILLDFPIDFIPSPVDDDLDAQVFLQMGRRLPDCDALTINEVDSWLQEDANDQGWQVLDDEEIVFGQQSETEESDEDEDGTPEASEPTARDALQGISSVLDYYQRQWDCTEEQLQFLQNLQQYFINNILADNRMTNN